MERFKEKYGPWALVTGAGSGIGAEFANQLAGLGLNLVLVDRREDTFDEITGRLTSQHGIEVKVIQKDLEEPDFLPDILQATDSLEIGLLVNNAGYALTGDFLDHDLEQEIGLLRSSFLTRLARRWLNSAGAVLSFFLPLPPFCPCRSGHTILRQRSMTFTSPTGFTLN